MEVSKLNVILTKNEICNYLNEFFYSCINEICGFEKITYEQFMKTGWSEEEYNYIHTVISALFTNPAVLYLDKAKLPQEFLDFPDNIQEQMLNCLKEKQESLVNVLLKKYSEEKNKTMIDFDWRLKMIMGSSSVASHKEPILQLDLRVMENKTESIVDFEMNKNELDSFIKALESVV